MLTILGFYNAKILIHRPLMAILDPESTFDRNFHAAACLDGARKTIQLLFESYTHRHYFRTWYYNSTYVLYASMTILYIVLTNWQLVPGAELVRDVEKSLDVLHAMDNIKVAKRCADLILEVLEVVRRQLKPGQHSSRHASTNFADAHIFHLEADNRGTGAPGADRPVNGNVVTPDVSHALHSNRSIPSNMKNNLLASLIDPITLDGFASDLDFDLPPDLDFTWTTMESALWGDTDISQTTSYNL